MPCPLLSMELKLILEAILFSAQKPLSLKELRDVFAGAVEHAEGNETVRGLKKVKEEQLAAALEELGRDHDSASRSHPPPGDHRLSPADYPRRGRANPRCDGRWCDANPARTRPGRAAWPGGGCGTAN